MRTKNHDEEAESVLIKHLETQTFKNSPKSGPIFTIQYNFSYSHPILLGKFPVNVKFICRLCIELSS